MARPILIGGCGSSDTATVSKLIASHENIFCTSSLSIFDRGLMYDLRMEELGAIMRLGHFRALDASMAYPILLENEQTYCALAGDDRIRGLGWTKFPELITAIETSSSLQEAMDRFFAPMLAVTNATRWAEESGGNLLYYKQWLKNFPDGKVVLVYRNPRDTIAELVFLRNFNLHSAISRWVMSAEVVYNAIGASNVLVIPADNLAEFKEVWLEELFEFLEEEQPQIDEVPQAEAYWGKYHNGLSRGALDGISLATSHLHARIVTAI